MLPVTLSFPEYFCLDLKKFKPESNFFVNNGHCLKTCSATKVRSFGPIFSVGDQGLGGGGYDFES